jgi:nucleotide-binding universal stress UspA family protein
MLASDGSDSSAPAAELAAAIAGEHKSDVTVLHVGREHGEDSRHRLAAQTAAIQGATGTEPVSIIEAGDPHRRIVELAERERVSLVVIGSRGLGGIKALGSVSERVVHLAHCSVLVARDHAG